MNKKIEKALELFKNKEWDKAIDAFSRILEKETNNAGLYNNLALSYYYAGEPEQAEKFLLKALSINPKLAEVYINLTDLYFKQRNFTDAIDLLQNGLYELPDNLILRHYLARVYMEDARIDLAIDELYKIIEEQSENYDAYYDLARIYLELGNYDLAIEYFENVIKYKDNNEWVYFYLGQAYEANNEIDKALSNYLKAIAINEAFYPAYKKAGVLFLARNDYDDAIEYFEDYIKLGVSEEEIKTVKSTINRINKVKGEKLNSTKKYWVAFSSIEEIDSRFVQRLYNYFGDIETAFNASLSDLSQIDGLNMKKAQTFIEKRAKVNPDKVLDEIISRNITFVTFEDEDYPYLLKNISDPPMVLYIKGDLKLCNLEKTIAVVGSRKASTASKDVLAKILSELRNTDICIVSGLASGIDTTAHKAALENNLKTIGVIASGFDFIYPTANRELYKQIEDGNGAVVTEYFPTFQPLQFRFPQRNRIVSGISSGTLVAEAAIRSGALITANLCLEQGRELMCIPGLVSNPNTAGIYKLLKQGASMVTCGEDILNALNWEIKAEKQLKMDFNNFSVTEQKILQAIEVEPKGFDAISSETRIDANELLVSLTNLELSGAIKQIEGEKYKIY